MVSELFGGGGGCCRVFYLGMKGKNHMEFRFLKYLNLREIIIGEYQGEYGYPEEVTK